MSEQFTAGDNLDLYPVAAPGSIGPPVIDLAPLLADPDPGPEHPET